MEIIIGFALVAMVIAVIAHLTHWVKAKYEITSPHLKTAGILLVCITVLLTVLFGTRLMLKPDVAIVYNDHMFSVYSNLTVNDKGQHVLEQRTLVGCNVVLTKTYPLMIVFGRDQKQVKLKMPCDLLTPEMKTDIANTTSYLKEELK